MVAYPAKGAAIQLLKTPATGIQPHYRDTGKYQIPLPGKFVNS